ncbi:MAG: FIST N domain protein [Planctomycetes bacterium ADurb.Bin126]|nr:MAG: FIST N domain protein [Planctomycetes bacterium ADurb.Bin126]HOD81310.1 FIST N-terminal domain-containing protein [Phycisphaerae bacterium]HQL74560.1 FIST N-terminal domain-containing protein [Phycisphaerae bacterium]
MMRTVTVTMVLAGLVLIGCDGVEKPAPVAPVEPAAKAATVSPPRDIEPADASRQIVFATASSDLEDPAAAGKAAAQAAKDQVGARPVKAVLISECYEGKDRKTQVLAGVAGVFTATLIHGGSTYGSFLQSGLAGGESVSVLVIAGKDVDVKVACNEKLDTAGLTLEQNKDELEKRLAAGGAELARRLPRTGDSRLLIVVADAHSPKNGPLVAGIQTVVGKRFPITGGSVNKNAGQSVVYYQGQMLADAAVGIMLSGNFKVAMAGRQAKENDQVIATAREGSAEAVDALAQQQAKPAVLLAFDCAGRKGRLKNVADELAAVQHSCGKRVAIFGTYNAGEIGPADLADKAPDVLSSGVGWHAMFTAIGW